MDYKGRLLKTKETLYNDFDEVLQNLHTPEFDLSDRLSQNLQAYRAALIEASQSGNLDSEIAEHYANQADQIRDFSLLFESVISNYRLSRFIL